MNNIRSFYENMATSVAYNSNAISFEIIAIETEQKNQLTAPGDTNNTIIENVVEFIKPLHRSNDIVNYLIEREQRTLLSLT